MGRDIGISVAALRIHRTRSNCLLKLCNDYTQGTEGAASLGAAGRKYLFRCRDWRKLELVNCSLRAESDYEEPVRDYSSSCYRWLSRDRRFGSGCLIRVCYSSRFSLLRGIGTRGGVQGSRRE